MRHCSPRSRSTSSRSSSSLGVGAAGRRGRRRQHVRRESRPARDLRRRRHTHPAERCASHQRDRRDSFRPRAAWSTSSAENRMQEEARREEQAARVTDEVPSGRRRESRTSPSPTPTNLTSWCCVASTSTSRTDPPWPWSARAVRASRLSSTSCSVCTVPPAGDMTAGGISIFDNLPAWQRQLAVVPQDVTLLDETLARQHRLRRGGGRTTAWREAVERAQLERPGR